MEDETSGGRAISGERRRRSGVALDLLRHSGHPRLFFRVESRLGSVVRRVLQGERKGPGARPLSKVSRETTARRRSQRYVPLVLFIFPFLGYLDWITQAEDMEPVNDEDQEEEHAAAGLTDDGETRGDRAVCSRGRRQRRRGRGAAGRYPAIPVEETVPTIREDEQTVSEGLPEDSQESVVLLAGHPPRAPEYPRPVLRASPAERVARQVPE